MKGMAEAASRPAMDVIRMQSALGVEFLAIT